VSRLDVTSPDPFIKIHEGVLDAAFCREVMARFDADARVQPDPQPDYSTRKYLNISTCADWGPINLKFARLVTRLVREYFARAPELAAATHEETSDDGFVVVRYDPGDAVIMHVDGQCSVPPNNGLRLATVLFYLNDVDDGGETWFPLQNVKVPPKEGRVVVFPVGFTHPHSVLATKQKRYIMQTWITDPSLLVFHRDDVGDLEALDDDAGYDEED
jgi:hypothetical protein